MKPPHPATVDRGRTLPGRPGAAIQRSESITIVHTFTLDQIQQSGQLTDAVQAISDAAFSLYALLINISRKAFKTQLLKSVKEDFSGLTLSAEGWLGKIGGLAEEALNSPFVVKGAIEKHASLSLQREEERRGDKRKQLEDKLEKIKKPKELLIIDESSRKVLEVDVNEVKRRISRFEGSFDSDAILDAAAQVSCLVLEEKGMLDEAIVEKLKGGKKGKTITWPKDVRQSSDNLVGVLKTGRILLSSVDVVKLSEKVSLFVQGNKVNALGTYVQIRNAIKGLDPESVAEILWGKKILDDAYDSLRLLLFVEMTRGPELAVWLSILPFMLFEKTIDPGQYVDLNPMAPVDASNKLSEAREKASKDASPSSYMPSSLKGHLKKLTVTIFKTFAGIEPKHKRTRFVYAFLDAILDRVEGKTIKLETLTKDLLSTPPSSPITTQNEEKLEIKKE